MWCISSSSFSSPERERTTTTNPAMISTTPIASRASFLGPRPSVPRPSGSASATRTHARTPAIAIKMPTCRRVTAWKITPPRWTLRLFERDDRQARVGVLHPGDVLRRLGDEDLASRANDELEDVAGDRRAVLVRQDAVDVELALGRRVVRVGVLGQRDSPVQRRQLRLARVGDVDVFAALNVERGQLGRGDRADPGELGR